MGQKYRKKQQRLFLVGVIGMFSLGGVQAGTLQPADTLFFGTGNDICPDGTVEKEHGEGLIVNGVFVPNTTDPSRGFVEECVSTSGAVAANSQVIRNFTSITFQHVMSAAPELWGIDTGLVSGGNKIGASSDKGSSLSFWGMSNLTQISEENGTHFDSDIYQFTGGFDKAMGDVFFGSALTYAHGENEQGGTTSTSETVGFTPYIAYKVNDFIFASGMAGYLYTHTNKVDGGSDLDTHDYITEGNINAFKVINSFILKGRLGVRYKHTISSPEVGVAGRDNSFDELTWVGDGEVGYQFNNKLRVYSGLLYEYYDREASGVSVRVRDSIAFMRYGVEYPVREDLTLGAKIQHDLNEEDSDYITGAISARLAF